MGLIVEEGLKLHQLGQRRKQEEILWKQKYILQWISGGEHKS